MGARIPSGSLGHHQSNVTITTVMKGPAMSDLGKAHIVIMWTVGPDDVAAGDRLFESHGKWMTGHPREGDAALLSYSISKGPSCRIRGSELGPNRRHDLVLDEFTSHRSA